MTGTFLKRLILIVVVFFTCVALVGHAQGQEVSDDANFKLKISKDLKAERPRFDFAYFLYTKKRFKDAREQLGFLFGLNSAHVLGRKLLKSLDEVEGLADLQYQDQQMRMFIVEKLKADKEEELAAGDKSGGSLTPERIAKIQGNLDKRYEFSFRIKLDPKAADGELKFQDALGAATKSGNWTEAEKTARTWVGTFEKSPIAKADFGAFLIMRDRFVQAEVLLNEAFKTNPECLKLKIVADILKEIKGVKSSEKTTDLKGRLTDELAVYQLAVTGKIEEAKRAPSGTTVPVPATAPTTTQVDAPPIPGTTPAPNATSKPLDGLPAVLTAEEIEKLKLPESANPPMHRRK